MIVEELIVLEEEPKEDVTILESKATDDQDEELDLEAYVLNSIMDVFYDDYDISFAALFETDDLFYSKVDAMKSDFAYLCNVFLMVIMFVMIILCICLTLIPCKLNHLI